jgi:hypothetical protein
MSDGFLGRWSKRKLDVKEGKQVEAEPLVQAQPLPAASPASLPGELPVVAIPDPSASRADAEGERQPAEEPPPLTLEDVKALTADSDFSRFTAPNVAPEVKNAALKKLFSDPRYNVMDGLDVYTGDYTQPDPIPTAMLRQLASAKFLNLFDREEKEEAEAEAAEAARRARDVADNPTSETVAQSQPAALPAVPEPPDHADPDLRLQQDHAAPGENPGRGPE